MISYVRIDSLDNYNSPDLFLCIWWAVDDSSLYHLYCYTGFYLGIKYIDKW